jgi:hypothetical protein
LYSVLVLEKDRVHFPVCVSVCLCDRVSNEKKLREQVGVRDKNLYLFFSLHEELSFLMRPLINGRNPGGTATWGSCEESICSMSLAISGTALVEWF